MDFESAQHDELHSVRDRLWLWGHEAGAHNGEWGILGKSRMTAAEAAFYMSLSNLIMVRYRGKPEPPCDQYALAFTPLKCVVWSIVGAFGATESEDRSNVRDLAMRTPNIRGVIMDDLFLTQSADPDKATKIAALSVGVKLSKKSIPLNLDG